MLVPPQLGSKERKEHDINILRMFFVVCENHNISEDEDIQKSFFHLVKWAGKSNFLEEYLMFESFVQKYVEKKKSQQI
ncbi:hypothetical protein EHP00_467 [Ecytonucleospora hepatopenaei]|uniref:Uncharacterized protein n=1 Tax=Ecytonucleospora hepatopenaei TaxID=646526 RepID=A0A1W0E8Z5_9MICR|nr:hypothetical protein EHP00_467 [Ecytonucleospora hepatopenaei]